MAAVCVFPNGTRIYLFQETRHGVHCHAIKGRGKGKRFARIFWRGDTILYEQSSKRRLRLTRDELDEATQWVARHRNELDEAYGDVQAGKSPQQIPYP